MLTRTRLVWFLLVLFTLSSCAQAERISVKKLYVLPEQAAQSARFSPDSEFVATGSLSRLALWDTLSGAEVFSYAHSDNQARNYAGQALLDIAIADINFSSDGKYVVSNGQDGSYRIFDRSSNTYIVPSENQLNQRPVDEGLARMNNQAGADSNIDLASLYHGRASISAGDSSRLALLRDHTITVYDLRSQSVVSSFDYEAENGKDVENFAISGNGSQVIVREHRNMSAQVWDVDRGQKQFDVQTGVEAFDIQFSHGGKYIACACGIFGASKTAVLFWDASNGQLLWQHNFDEWIYSIDFNKDDRSIAVRGTTHAWVLGVSNGNEVMRATDQGTITSATLSPDGKFLLTSSDDKTVRLWSIAGKQEIYRYDGASGVRGAVFSSDGKKIAVEEANQVVVFSVE